MKISIIFGLGILAMASNLWVHAADTPAQAAARAALEEKLNELDAAPVAVAATAPMLVPAPPAPKANTWDVVAIPDAATTNLAETAPENKLPTPTVTVSATPPADAIRAEPAVTAMPAQPQIVTAPASQPARRRL